jgi:mediator of RNA polymerase II transcription subunit 31
MNEEDSPTVKRQKLEGRPYEETDADNQLRFLMELEFVQCLANPQYLNCKLQIYHALYLMISVYKVLAQSRYFEDDAFVNYLKYLQYWKNPEYAIYLA